MLRYAKGRGVGGIVVIERRGRGHLRNKKIGVVPLPRQTAAFVSSAKLSLTVASCLPLFLLSTSCPEGDSVRATHRERDRHTLYLDLNSYGDYDHMVRIYISSCSASPCIGPRPGLPKMF